MKKKTFMKLCPLLSIIIMIGIIAYIISMVDLFIKIKNEKQINTTEYQNYVIGRGVCDTNNSTILSLYDYDCTKVGCQKCSNNCSPPNVIKLSSYLCFNVAVINENNMIYTLPIGGCLRYIDIGRISMETNPWNDIRFFSGILLGVPVLMILVGIMVAVYYLLEDEKTEIKKRELILLDYKQNVERIVSSY